jgi:hypothetical protein
VSRVLAVVLAVGMIAGALYVRGRIDDDDSGGDSSGGDDNGQLVCDPVLAEACRAVHDDVVEEDAATTAEELFTADRVEFDGWVTPGPWPAMVDALRSAAGRPALFGDGGEAVASSRLALVAPPEAPEGWKAVGEAAGAGDLRLGWRDPATGLGVLQVGAFAVGFFDGPDFATNDFAEPGFTSYLEGIEREAAATGEPLERRLQQGVSFSDAVISFRAEADPLLEDAAPGRREDLQSLYPEPVIAVEAVVAGDGADDVGTELQERGWDEPVPSGLPNPGVLAALWQEISR